MVFVTNKPKRGGSKTLPDFKAAPKAHAPSRDPTFILPSEPSRTSLTRVCDNRLRAIRIWWSRRRNDQVELLLADLKHHIKTAENKNNADDWWYQDLGRLVHALVLGDDDSIGAIYNYLGIPAPWSR